MAINKRRKVMTIDRDLGGVARKLIKYLQSIDERNFTGTSQIVGRGRYLDIYETPRTTRRIKASSRWPTATKKTPAEPERQGMHVRELIEGLRLEWFDEL